MKNAIIFDFDGTIAETIPLSLAAIRAAYADNGLPPEQTATPMAGRLAAIYAVSKDGSACWEYGIGTDTWTSLS